MVFEVAEKAEVSFAVNPRDLESKSNLLLLCMERAMRHSSCCPGDKQI